MSQDNGTWTSRYLYVDHIGSTDAITNASGTVLQRFTFDPWGKKTSGQVISPVGASYTLRGFTGHESVEEADIIHMNGRIYDSTLGRFLQADPFIQAPKNTQSLNRYSYVLNNPLTLTDPSGYFSMSRWWRRNEQAVRTVAAITINIMVCGGGCTFMQAVAVGAISGGIASGNVNGAAAGAFSAGVFYGIGSAFSEANCTTCYKGDVLTSTAKVGKVLSHAIAGGVMSQLQGGKFGHGFVSAGVSQAFSKQIDDLSNGNVKVIVAGLLGGTVSVASGGKFANGAITAAFARALNDQSHGSQSGGKFSDTEQGLEDAIDKAIKNVIKHRDILSDRENAWINGIYHGLNSSALVTRIQDKQFLFWDKGEPYLELSESGVGGWPTTESRFDGGSGSHDRVVVIRTVKLPSKYFTKSSPYFNSKYLTEYQVRIPSYIVTTDNKVFYNYNSKLVEYK